MRTGLLLSLLAACSVETGDETVAHPAREHSEDSAQPVLDSGEGNNDLEAVDAARIVLMDFPLELGCGASGLARVGVENTGSTIWTREEGLKLGAYEDEDAIFDSGDVRVWLEEGEAVLPGDRHTFEIDLLGTDAGGWVTSDWQMVREGEHWFGEVGSVEVEVVCEDGGSGSEETSSEALPLPDMSHVVEELAEEHPEMLADSCLDEGGGWDFLDTLVDRLRETDERWGYNWKRGVEGDPSEDVVDYHFGDGEREGSEEVYIIDVIVGHCGDSPEPGWLDQTQATADAGTIGRWTSRGRF